VRLPAAIPVCVAMLAVAAGSARADTYCVGKTGCDHDVADLQTALNSAAARAGTDTVDLAGSVTSASGFTYSDPDDPVHIEGSDNPTLHASNPGATTLRVVGAPGSTITGLDVIVQPDQGTGIETNGTVKDSVIESDEGTAQKQFGVRLDAGGNLTDSHVQLPLAASPVDTAVVVANGPGTAVSDSRLEGPVGMSASAPTASSTVQRVQMAFSGSGIFVEGGAAMVVEDTLLETRSGGGALHTGALVDSTGADSSLAMNHVTIAGAAGTGSVALHATASGGGRTGLTFRNGVIDSYPIAIARSATGAGSMADVASDYSDYAGTVQSSGGGGLSETNHLTSAPGFLSATDFHLRSDSSLVDAGAPGPLDTDESPGDASGQPRVVDGSGDCVARRDIGAFEFQPGERAPVAVADVTTVQPATDQPVGFDAGESCDPDGDALSFVWSFDDGSVGEGVTRERSFSRAGLHFAAVTVTDSTGRSTMAVAAVRVTRPAPPPFAGVTIPKQTVRVSKSGVVGLKLRCPLGTVGACSGKVTLSRAGDRRMGAASVAIARGATRKVNVRLTRRARTALKKAKRLNATVTVAGRDANETGHRTNGTVKLVAPRS
jgi:uncharacterized protein YwbE